MIVDKLAEVLPPAVALDKVGNQGRSQVLVAGGSKVELGDCLSVGRKHERHPLVCRLVPGSNLARCQEGTVAAQVALHKGLADRREDTQVLP